MKKVLLSAAALTVLFAACKKETKETPRKDLLVGNWNWTEVGIDSNANKIVDQGETELVSSMGFTGKLNILANGDGNMIITVPVIGSDTSNFKWSLINNDSKIRLISVEENDTTELNINSLTNNKLTVLEGTDSTASWYIFTK